MRKKALSIMIGITLALTMIFGLLPACGGGETTPTGTGGPIAQGEKFTWRYQSNANAGTATYWTEEEYVSTIGKASGGRLTVELSPQGAIVGSMEIFDAVASGAIESGNS